MNDPLHPFGFPSEQNDSWFSRIRENFRQFLIQTPFTPTSANGAPLHLVHVERTPREGGAQTVSVVAHALIIGGIFVLMMHPAIQQKVCPDCEKPPSTSIVYAPPEQRFGTPSLGGGEGGGHRDPIPATSGEFAPHSSTALAPPRLPDNAHPQLPIAQAILDKDAPELAPVVTNVGLPWMKDRNNSQGPGGPAGIGGAPGNRIGDGPGDEPGEGTGPNGPYANVLSRPVCSYCPTPIYTDEARKAKVQGTVTLEVLVGPDGRAAEVRISRGLGMGLDERAEQTIRGWKFVPARDANKHAVAAWVTIETIFRLF